MGKSLQSHNGNCSALTVVSPAMQHPSESPRHKEGGGKLGAGFIRVEIMDRFSTLCTAASALPKELGAISYQILSQPEVRDVEGMWGRGNGAGTTSEMLLLRLEKLGEAC